MKFYRLVGIQCPVCGQHRLRVLSDKVKGVDRYMVECAPRPEQEGAGVVPCRHGTWSTAAEEDLALKFALGNMVQELDANLKVRTGQRDHIVDSLVKQLRQEAA